MNLEEMKRVRRFWKRKRKNARSTDHWKFANQKVRRLDADIYWEEQRLRYADRQPRLSAVIDYGYLDGVWNGDIPITYTTSSCSTSNATIYPSTYTYNVGVSPSIVTIDTIPQELQTNQEVRNEVNCYYGGIRNLSDYFNDDDIRVVTYDIERRRGT